MSWEPISPELALVDPELRARACAALELPVSPPRPTRARSTPLPSAARADRRYPFWARVTAALWLLVLGILVGGAAIPHAQDAPRVIPANEDPTFFRVPKPPPATPPAHPGQP